jgi:ABC-type dipeptide/oligopeptide/nickel transport system ATPase subunit
LSIVKLTNLVKEAEGGFEQVRIWNDYLSGGEK